ncbi:MAG: chromosomal replication initiator protein DnaA [Magnetococcales bacterium]|nr:chromosomal replication initiator protein DnaA [Magnetococcales bacterium]MBF0155627.1 chromosomal replication initiator protein DnaA [Magnetococcales bacterium]
MASEAVASGLWGRVLEAVREQVAPHVYDAWLKPLKPVGDLADDCQVVLAANGFSAEYVQAQLAPLLEAGLSREAGRTVRFLCRVDPESAEADLSDLGMVAEFPEVAPGLLAEGAFSRERLATDHGLDGRYSFESFVVGSSNQFAHAAAERVAEAPSVAYNPLFVHGGVGLGKTHILHAIGNRILQTHPELRVLYISSEKFMTQLINSLRFKRVFDFKENFRSVDILLVDDIQFIAGKKATQDEFFHTFNALFEAKKQIILSSDSSPKEIEHLEERLRSRFGWGLVADIHAPDLETRVAILKKKADRERVELADDVAFYLADMVPTNVRELEGALIRVSALASLTGKPISLSLAKDALQSILRTQQKSVSIESIQKTVASYYKIRPADLRSDKRSRLFSHPRQIAMYLCKCLTRHSYPEIGHQFGKKDHTTVLYAVRQIEKKRGTDPVLAEELESLMGMLRS